MLKWNRYILPTLMISIVMLISISTQISAEAQEKSGVDVTNYVYLPSLNLQPPDSPLFERFLARWDGFGFLHLDTNYTVGSHIQRYIPSTEGDVAEVQNYLWYDPNPREFNSSFWTDFYSLSTGRFLSSSSTANPYWKWGFPWIIPFDFEFQNNQDFLATGPFTGYNNHGKLIQYWELINQERFLFWDDGGEWKQYVLRGDALLRYDAGKTNLLIHDDVKRTDFYEGEQTEYTVHYIVNLTSSNSWPGYSQADVIESIDISSNFESNVHPYADLEQYGMSFDQGFSLKMPND